MTDASSMKGYYDDIWLYISWACVAGVTIPIATANNVILNTRSDNPEYQAFYTSLLGLVLGGFAVLPVAYLTTTRCKAPTRWWSLSGGIWTIPAFGIVIATPDLGIQLTLLIGLVAQLGATLLLDRLDGRLIFSPPSRSLAVGIVLLGVFLDQRNVLSSSHHHKSYSLLETTHVVKASSIGHNFVRDSSLAALAGIGYTLQSKCNTVLAKDVGSAAGATAVSAVVKLLVSVPIIWYLCVCLDTWPTFLLQDWPRFVYAGFQSAFYIGSLAVLPRFIGYTTTFVAIHCGSFVTSILCDATETLGKRIPFSISRAVALMVVIVGVWMFSKATVEEVSCKSYNKCNGNDLAEIEDKERASLTEGRAKLNRGYGA
mmetsp:Transcript_84197/g.132983  ORF Transcript_84197/g.132983 Transcript_84197/m.132983 type:complete len:371 (-) Transcript_84197:290-1402(-)